MRIAVVGAGIVGSCTAWALAQRRGIEVVLYDRHYPMRETSCSSSKLLHGGLRYLETGQFKLVRKALLARREWLTIAPHLCTPLQFIFPIYRDMGRPRWQVSAGMHLYDLLAWGSRFPSSRWLPASDVISAHPTLRQERLIGAYSFFDAQMDDYALGTWVIQQFLAAGGKLICNHPISHLTQLSHPFDRIVNAAGPWASQLRSSLSPRSPIELDYVRGSHIILNRPCSTGLLLQVPNENRIFFALPFEGNTLVGTTEVRQAYPDNPGPGQSEIQYLLNAYNHYFVEQPATTTNILHIFSGVRPLVKSSANPTQASRDWVFERTGSFLHIYGGKWTTALQQGREAATAILR